MFIVAALLAATLTLTDRRAVTLDARTVRIGDVVRGAGPAAHAVIVRLPRNRNDVVLSRRAIGALIRRAVPGVTVIGEDRLGAITFSTPIVPPRVATCTVTRTPVAAWAAVLAEHVISIPCDGHTAFGMAGYDRGRGEMVARRAIEAGVNLGAMRLPKPSVVRTGDQLTLISRAGPVTVERVVTAMQAGRDGHRIFVRDGAGKVSSIAFAVAAQ